MRLSGEIDTRGLCAVRLRVAPTNDMRAQNEIEFREVIGVLDTGARATIVSPSAVVGLMLRSQRPKRASGMHADYREYQAFMASLSLRADGTSTDTLSLRATRILVSHRPLAGTDALIGVDALAVSLLVVDYPRRTWSMEIS